MKISNFGDSKVFDSMMKNFVALKFCEKSMKTMKF
jgi:hypothetical protein